MIGVSELILIIRAQNQASAALGRVSRDVRKLQATRDLRTRQMQIQVRQMRVAEQMARQQTRLRASQEQAQVRQMRIAEQMSAHEANISNLRASNIARDVQARRESEMALKRLAVEHANLGRQAVNASRESEAATKSLGVQQQILARQVEDTNAAMRQMPIERYRALGNAISHVGRVATIAGAAITVGMGAAAVSAAHFQTQVSLAATQARRIGAPLTEVADKTQRLMKVIIAQMREFPASSQEMSDSLYQIFSGTNVQNIGKASQMLRLFNQMAVAGGGSLEAMTDAGITLYNNFGNLNKNANLFFAAVRYGRFNVEQYGAALTQIIPNAKAVGQSFLDVSAAMAVLSRQTGAVRTRQDATGLARLTEVLARPEMIAGFKRFGVQLVDNQGHLRSWLNIFQQITKQMPELSKGGVNVLNLFKRISAAGGEAGSKGFQGTIQARRTFLYLLQNVPALARMYRDLTVDTDELTAAYRRQAATPGVRWDVMVNQFKALALEIGTAAIPAFITLTKPIVDLLHWFSGLSDHTKRLIADFLVFGGAVTLVGGVILTVVGSLIALVAVLAPLIAVLGPEAGVAGAMAAVTGEAGGMSGALVLIAGSVAVLIEGFGELKRAIEALPDLPSWLKRAGGYSFSDLAKDLHITPALHYSLTDLAAEIGLVSKAQKDLGNVIKSQPKEMGPGVGGRAAAALDLGTRAATRMKNAMQAAMEMNTQLTPKFARLYENWARLDQAYKGDRGSVSLFNRRMAAWRALEAYVAAANARMAASSMASDSTAEKWNRARILRTIYRIALMRQAMKKSTDPVYVFKIALKVAKLEKRLEAHTTPETKAAADAAAGVWDDYYQKLDQYQQDQIDNQQKSYDAMQNQTEGYLSTVQNLFSQFYQQNQTAFGGIFQGPVLTGARADFLKSFGFRPRGADVLADLRAQLSKFRQWRGLLNRLVARGAPLSLLAQIEEAGPDSIDAVRALLSLPRRKFQQYVSVFRESQRAIAGATKTDMSRQLAQWKSYGSDIMKAILSGMDEQSAQFKDYLLNLAKSLGYKPAAADGATKKAPPKPPPKPPPPPPPPPPRHPRHPRHPRPVGGRESPGGPGREGMSVHYHINAQHMTLETALRKAKHYQRNMK